MINRFYRSATEVLIRHDAIIDKLIGDEVMALFIRGICGPMYHLRAVEAASALLRAVGYGQSGEPWLALDCCSDDLAPSFQEEAGRALPRLL